MPSSRTSPRTARGGGCATVASLLRPRHAVVRAICFALARAIGSSSATGVLRRTPGVDRGDSRKAERRVSGSRPPSEDGFEFRMAHVRLSTNVNRRRPHGGVRIGGRAQAGETSTSDRGSNPVAHICRGGSAVEPLAVGCHGVSAGYADPVGRVRPVKPPLASGPCRLAADDRGVSPVGGVVPMIVLTARLASTFSVTALGFGGVETGRARRRPDRPIRRDRVCRRRHRAVCDRHRRRGRRPYPLARPQPGLRLRPAATHGSRSSRAAPGAAYDRGTLRLRIGSPQSGQSVAVSPERRVPQRMHSYSLALRSSHR